MYKTKFYSFILVITLLCTLAGCATIYNPATERREFIAISTKTEVAMGESIHEDIVKKKGISENKDNVQRLRRIGQRLTEISDRKDYKYNFYLVDKEDLNAFTTPGGNVYFYSGLYNKLETDDEIAAVLAHEIGHCAARHIVKRFQAALGYNLISALVFSQVEMDEKTKTAIAVAGNVGIQLATAAYSRKDEYEADRLGIKYMYLAGYDLNGMIKAFEMLQKESKGPRTPLILRTHPYIDDRIEEIKLEIPRAPEKYDKILNYE